MTELPNVTNLLSKRSTTREMIRGSQWVTFILVS
ncbi:hypothetical protein LOK49_LG12G02307 [Camellia lanceoleosa]|uniref:Uncharacterized protein n=1 Tax=Camellia lanceoleosa TaxID=1840588 RepID=A0ACC0FV30_9ERIC|nr:hypothetical protein LOK49_LG12G02307 [Camellia lanceoleosa]